MVDRPCKRMMPQRSYPPRPCDLPPSHDSTICPSCCGAGGSAECKSISKKLQTVEFSMYDTMLYLDAYPHSKEALAYYKKLCAERNALRESLAKKCHRPVTAAEVSDTDGWVWIDSPWPWEESAN